MLMTPKLAKKRAASKVLRSSGRSVEWSGAFLTVNHPRNTESVGHHAEAHGPERFLERHPHSSGFGQRSKDALRVGWVVETERHVEAFGRDVILGQFVAAHQQHVPHLHAR